MRTEVTDDRDLYERFVEGDLDAFETLFRRYERQVYGWVFRIVRRQTEAEELTVETFWQIYRARARFSPSLGFGPWARRIATNLVGFLNELLGIHA
jgi:RNA polymerase sigma-70 factor, ECF subfamily